MRFTFNEKKVQTSENLREYAEKKIGKLERLFKTEADAVVTFSIERVNLWITISIIGVVTFLICVAGIYLSKQLGRRFRRRASMIGGIVLILYGIKIFIEHTLAGI